MHAAFCYTTKMADAQDKINERLHMVLLLREHDAAWIAGIYV